MNEAEWRVRAGWRGSMVAVLLNIVGMSVDVLIGRALPRMPLWPNVMSVAVAALLAGVLLARRQTATTRLVHGVFLANVTVILAALWFTNSVYAESGRAWVPFQANKLGMMTAALLAPELWVGLLSIAAFAAVASCQLATFSDAARDAMAIGEPAATLVIGTFAAVLLVHRVRRMALEREVVRAQTEKTAMLTFARAVLAIRDLSRTPLQIITFASAVARIRHPEQGPLWDRIDRAAADIHTLDGRLRDYERVLTWGPGEESFDPAARLSSSLAGPARPDRTRGRRP